MRRRGNRRCDVRATSRRWWTSSPSVHEERRMPSRGILREGDMRGRGRGLRPPPDRVRRDARAILRLRWHHVPERLSSAHEGHRGGDARRVRRDRGHVRRARENGVSRRELLRTAAVDGAGSRLPSRCARHVLGSANRLRAARAGRSLDALWTARAVRRHLHRDTREHSALASARMPVKDFARSSVRAFQQTLDAFLSPVEPTKRFFS